MLAVNWQPWMEKRDKITFLLDKAKLESSVRSLDTKNLHRRLPPEIRFHDYYS